MEVHKSTNISRKSKTPQSWYQQMRSLHEFVIFSIPLLVDGSSICPGVARATLATPWNTPMMLVEVLISPSQNYFSVTLECRRFLAVSFITRGPLLTSIYKTIVWRTLIGQDYRDTGHSLVEIIKPFWLWVNRGLFPGWRWRPAAVRGDTPADLQPWNTSIPHCGN